MKFALIDHVDDTVKVSERKLVDAIYAAIRPLGYKVSAMMDEGEVTKFITGTNAIIKEACGCGCGDIKITPGINNVETARAIARQKSDRRQHILVSVCVCLVAVILTILYRCLK